MFVIFSSTILITTFVTYSSCNGTKLIYRLLHFSINNYLLFIAGVCFRIIYLFLTKRVMDTFTLELSQHHTIAIMTTRT